MRKYIFWGLLLIMTGVLWLLKIAHVVHFSFMDFLTLWPLILVWVGIGLLPIKDGYKILLDLLAFGIGLVLLLHPIEIQWGRAYTYDKRTVYDKTEVVERSSTFHPNKDFSRASMELRAGASEIQFHVGKTNLINVHSLSNEKVKLKVDEKSQNAHVDLEILNSGNIGNNDDLYSIFLNPDPIWDIVYKVGATDNTIDLSPFKIESLELSSGASNIDLKIGDLYPEVNVDISMGASAINIALPDNMNCTIENKTAISGVHFDGFTRNSGGNHCYSVPDSVSKGTIHLSISAGISDISVTRYTTSRNE